MKIILITFFSFFSLSIQAQNLNDAEDANFVPLGQEQRSNERVNLPDNRDDDFIPASKEQRQKEEVRGGTNDFVEEGHGPDSNDRYLDDDNFGTSGQ